MYEKNELSRKLEWSVDFELKKGKKVRNKEEIQQKQREYKILKAIEILSGKKILARATAEV